MTQEEKLVILKQDLTMTSTARDDYLATLLDMAEVQIANEGISLADDVEGSMLTIQYAAYLFRKRASDNCAMPRFLRYSLNNLKVKQRGGLDDI